MKIIYERGEEKKNKKAKAKKKEPHTISFRSPGL
jgi:hypothetical protein